MRIYIKIKPLIVTAVLGALLSTSSCDFAAVNKDLPAILGRMQDDKDLVEAFVHDLKQTPAKDLNPQLDLAENQYADARAAQQAYFSAVRVAVADGRKQINLDARASEAEAKTTAFIRTASSILMDRDRTTPRGSANAETAQSEIPKTVVTFPHEISADLGGTPKSERTTLLNDLERRTSWKSWPDL